MKFIDLAAQQLKIRKRLEDRISTVLDHGKYIMGPEVYQLEEKLANYVGVNHCISCSSGTDALLIPLMAYGIGHGDAVITTPFTYIATAEVISLLGAKPIFVDIYEDTFNMNPDLIEDAVKKAEIKGLKVKAIMPVDLFGLPARYRLIKDVAKEHGLIIIEDAAQGFGGKIRGARAGSFGDVSSTSFFPAKPLGCYGDGGAIFTDDNDLLDIMKSIRVHGGGIDKYENIRLGINGRLDTIQAAILLEKLSIFEEEIKLRNTAAAYYSDNLSPSYKTPYIPKKYSSSWAQYSLLARSESERNNSMNILENHNIPSMIYYRIPLHLQTVFKKLGYKIGDFPITERVSKKIFSLPMHPYLSMEDQDYIIKTLQKK